MEVLIASSPGSYEMLRLRCRCPVSWRLPEAVLPQLDADVDERGEPSSWPGSSAPASRRCCITRSCPCASCAGWDRELVRLRRQLLPNLHLKVILTGFACGTFLERTSQSSFCT